MDKTNLVNMAYDLYKGTPKADYSADEINEILRKAVFGENYKDYIDGNNGFDLFRATRDGKIDYALIEQIITIGTQKEMEANHPILGFIDWQNFAEGDKGEWTINDESKESFFVSRIAYGTQGLRRQRLFGGQKVTVEPQLHGIKVYEELRRIASGRADFGHLIDVAVKSFARARIKDAYDATINVFNGISNTSKYYASGSFSEGTLTDLIDYVEAKTNMKASILASKQAVRKITGLRGDQSDTAKEQMFAMGYYGKFYTTPIYVMDNYLGSDDNFILPNDLYVIAGDEKFLKGVEEGQTLVIAGNPIDNADLSQEWLMAQSWGIEALIASKCGVYHLS